MKVIKAFFSAPIVALAVALCLTVTAHHTAQAQNFVGGQHKRHVISSIEVEGLQRIETATVLSYMKISAGDAFNAYRIDQSLKELYETGLFADVRMQRVGNTLIVQVVENPVINRIAFEGNKRIDDEDLRREIQLRPRIVYTRTKVQNDVARIQEIYRRSGRFAVSVEPQIIQLEQNRVDLVFEIEEGPMTEVQRINFIGNKKFSDSKLREVILTAESRWWRFLSASDTYDPDRLQFDQELLRKFYLEEGYADFRVISAVAELTPDREDFFITFTIEEGERYKFGEVSIQTSLHDLDASILYNEIAFKEGDWYDATKVEKTIQKLTDAVGALQYAFVDVRPQVRRDREAKIINIGFSINEGPRVFVERINIVGNVRTQDRVIRREFELNEGDAFNADKLRQSRQKVKDLGFFERVDVTTKPGSTPDQSVIEVEVAEQSTGEISVGAGFSSTEGALGEFAVRERNLLGKGQDLKLAASISTQVQEFSASFTEPYFLERNLAAGFDVYRVSQNNLDESSFKSRDTGLVLRMGYPLAEDLRHRLYYTLTQTNISDISGGASRIVANQSGDRTLSAVGSEFMYDKRNSKLDPTEGYYIKLGNDLAGLGGSTHYFASKLSSALYYPVIEEDVILTLFGEAGYIFGIGEDIIISDRYFLGGDSFRGFERGGIGARDLTGGNDDALGGNRYARGTVELSFPVGLPDEYGVKGHAFSDFGTLGHVDDKPLPGEIIRDEESLRMSVGVGTSWKSPLGPIRLDFAVPVMKESFDKVQNFRFTFGTKF